MLSRVRKAALTLDGLTLELHRLLPESRNSRAEGVYFRGSGRFRASALPDRAVMVNPSRPGRG